MYIKEPFEKYLSSGKFISPSFFKSKMTPAHIKFIPNEDSKTLQFGRALHTLILEPERFESDIVIIKNKEYPIQDYNEKSGTISMRFPDNSRYYNAKLVEAEMFHKTLIDESDYIALKNMRESIYEWVPDIDIYLNKEGAMIEYSFYGIAVFDEQGYMVELRDLPDFDYEFKKNEMPVKTRPDYLRMLDGSFYGLDIKSTKCAMPYPFEADCRKLGYDIQAAFIEDMVKTVFRSDEMEAFFFLAIEKTEPYLSELYMAPNIMLETGREKYQRRLEMIYKALKSGKWPGYQVYNPDYDPAEYKPAVIPYKNYENHKYW